MIPFYTDPTGSINRLVVAIVDPEDVGPLIERLVASSIGVTRLETAGAYLRRGNATLVIGVPAGRVEDVFAAISAECKTRTVLGHQIFFAASPDMLPALAVDVQVGGATVFVFEVERFAYLGDLD